MTLDFTLLLRGRLRNVTVCVRDYCADREIDWVDIDGIGEADLEPEESMAIAERTEEELDTPDDIEEFKARRAWEEEA